MAFTRQTYRARAAFLFASVLIAAVLLQSVGAVYAQQKDADRYRIALGSRTFTPREGIESTVRDSLTAFIKKGERRYILVQFTELPDQQARKHLAAMGVQTLSYVNGNAFYASLHGSGILGFATAEGRADRTLSLVRWIGEIESADRVAPEVLKGEFGAWAINPDSSVNVRVVFFEDVDSVAQVAALKKYADRFKPHSSHIWQVEITRDRLRTLIDDNAVQWIEQEPPPYEGVNDVSRNVIGVNNVQNLNTSTGVYGGFSGDGIQVMVRDDGIDMDGVGNDHEDFHGRVLRTNPPNSNSCHGTHVAGIVGGSGFRSNLNDATGAANGGTAFNWRGMAPNVELAGYSFGWDGTTYSGAKSTFGVDISNHSHTQGTTSTYSSDAVSVDNVVRNDTLYVFSAAGNNGVAPNNGSSLLGYFSITCSVSKNALCLGNFNSATGIRWRTSSMGPTFDGRIKPDVVAPGTDIRSAVYYDTHGNPRYQDDGYGLMTGTSMASPCAAGVTALMLEAFWDTFGWNTPKPLFSTMKAILIETATDQIQAANTPGEPNCPDFTGTAAQPPFFHAGPDWGTGYGLINADAAVSTIGNSRLYLQGTIQNNNDVDVYAIFVPAGVPELKVTLVWDDVAGSPTTANTAAKLVNDLNLQLVAPDGHTTHYPWILNPLNPANHTNVSPANITAATRGEDHLNNVEQVQVPNPAAGFWTVRVGESGLPMPPQSYSIASNLAILHWPNWSVSLHTGTAIPTGSFANLYNPGFNVILDVGYHLSSHWSIMGYLGYNAFRSDSPEVDDTYWMNLSVNLKYNGPLPLLPTTSLSYYVQAGPGYYFPKTGSGTLGGNVGFGLDQELSHWIYAEVGTDYHLLFSPDLRFWHAHAGIFIKL